MSEFLDKDRVESWYQRDDPWDYETNPHDFNRRERIKAAIPKFEYKNTLDIGCGNGFITQALPGEHVYGVEVSENACRFAQEKDPNPNHLYLPGEIFDLPNLDLPPMDLIVITGVLYEHYIGNSYNLVYLLIDELLVDGGILLLSHVHEWYKMRFPYLTVSREWFRYRQYYQIMEVYCK